MQEIHDPRITYDVKDFTKKSDVLQSGGIPDFGKRCSITITLDPPSGIGYNNLRLRFQFDKEVPRDFNPIYFADIEIGGVRMDKICGFTYPSLDNQKDHWSRSYQENGKFYYELKLVFDLTNPNTIVPYSILYAHRISYEFRRRNQLEVDDIEMIDCELLLDRYNSISNMLLKSYILVPFQRNS